MSAHRPTRKISIPLKLMNDMISEARNSLLSWSTEGSDGTALKSAKDIKSKLG